MIDLMSLAINDRETLELTHPVTGVILYDDAGQPVTLILAGTDSASFRTVEYAHVNARLRLGREKGLFHEASAEEREAETTELLAACTLGWRNLAVDGANFDFSPANARKLYADPRFRWIREQVDQFIANRANFLPSSARPSSPSPSMSSD